MIGRIEYQTADGVATQHVMTLPAQGAGVHWVILFLQVVYDGTPPTGDIVITGLEAATVLPILAGASDKQYSAAGDFFLGQDGAAVVVTVPAGEVGIRSLVYMTALKLLTGNLERLYFQS